MEVFMKMHSYITDELVNKIYHLSEALNKAKTIIDTLEEENNSLKEVIKYFQIENENNCSAA